MIVNSHHHIYLIGLLDCSEPIAHQHREAVSHHIGIDWRFLGQELGFSNGEMDHLEEGMKSDKYDHQEMIVKLLLHWDEKCVEQTTVAEIARALLKCQMHSALRELSTTVV